MPNLNAQIIDEFVAGNAREERRTITDLVAPITEARFTVKRRLTDDDSLFEKVITTSLDLNQGVIENAGDSGGDGVVTFYLQGSDTAELWKRQWWYEILILDADGHTYTPERGRIRALRPVAR